MAPDLQGFINGKKFIIVGLVLRFNLKSALLASKSKKIALNLWPIRIFWTWPIFSKS